MPHRRFTDADIIVQEIEDFVSKNNLSPEEKLKWRVTKQNYIDGLATRRHIEDKDLHTPKGLLVRAGVIGWAIFIMIIISTIVTYLPEQIKILSLP